MAPKQNDENMRRNVLIDAKQEFACLIGMKAAKDLIQQLECFARTESERRKLGDRPKGLTMHMVISGPPGTGKTSLARTFGKLLYGYGLCRNNNFVERARSTLVAKWIGHTERNTLRALKLARGGVLFIDEAPDLAATKSPQDYGPQAINVLTKYMEDHRDDVVVIVAGYREEMEVFLDSNKGLRGRFNWRVDLPCYRPHDLCQIFDQFAWDGEWVLSCEAKARAALLFHLLWATRGEGFDNGRRVRNVLELAMKRQGHRLNGKFTKAAPRNEITANDIPTADCFPDFDYAAAEKQLSWKAVCPKCNRTITFSVQALASVEHRCQCEALIILPWWSIDFVSAGDEFMGKMVDADHTFVPALARLPEPRPRREASNLPPKNKVPRRSSPAKKSNDAKFPVASSKLSDSKLPQNKLPESEAPNWLIPAKRPNDAFLPLDLGNLPPPSRQVMSDVMSQLREVFADSLQDPPTSRSTTTPVVPPRERVFFPSIFSFPALATTLVALLVLLVLAIGVLPVEWGDVDLGRKCAIATVINIVVVVLWTIWRARPAHRGLA